MREFTEDEWEALAFKAEEIGASHGKNAAEWWIQHSTGGRARGDVKATARRTLQLLEECDTDELNLPYDGMAAEMADDYNPRDLYRELEIDPEDDDDSGSLVTRYQDAFSAAVEHTVSADARRILGLPVYVGPVGHEGDVAYERGGPGHICHFTCCCCYTEKIPCTRKYEVPGGFICENCAEHREEEAE